MVTKSSLSSSKQLLLAVELLDGEWRCGMPSCISIVLAPLSCCKELCQSSHGSYIQLGIGTEEEKEGRKRWGEEEVGRRGDHEEEREGGGGRGMR